ncbi:MAG TPA: hypothetical protein VHM88_06765 [Candidatus Acidoferrales bacterium]|nr:hypothetical protein [Candidatus Acidoferrales bacterium]
MNRPPLRIRLQHDLPGVIESPAPSDPHLVVHLGKSTEIECHRGGKKYRGKTVHGDVDIIPAGIASRWILNEPGSDAIVRIPRQLLQTVAEGRGADFSNVVLFDRFQVRDPQIENLVWAMNQKLRAGIPAENCFLKAWD